MLSAKSGDKHETLVVAEGDAQWSDLGLRERLADEPVHYKQEEEETCCRVCGEHAAVWVDNSTSHNTHKMRCVPVK